jgi:hypothetical protein
MERITQASHHALSTGEKYIPEYRLLNAVVRTVLEPYDDGTSRERIVVSGPDVPVGAKAVTSHLGAASRCRRSPRDSSR